jgi:4-amino-4-deoxy-L-arabinose transferase-like glycosyltransferase
MVWLALAAGLVWFVTPGLRHLVPSDEGRYAEIAREMFASGDWVTIRYNDLKYFEKPPLHFWMTALAYEVFGVNEWSARLWIALSGAAGLVVTALAAARWYGARVGWFTGLVLLATPAWNFGAHFNTLDMSVSAMLAGVLAGVLLAQHPQACARQRRHWMWFAWGAMALAILAKGLIGIVLPGLVLVVYTLLARDWALWRRLHLVSGALLMLAIVVPWFMLVSLRNPEFPQFFFIHEHWERYTSTVHHRPGPLWYFVPQLLVDVLPWLGLIAAAVTVVWREPASGFRPKLLLAVWAGAIFVFFSASGSKLPGYILPIFPALAVLLALALGSMNTVAWKRQVTVALVITVLALLASLTARWFAGSFGLNATVVEYLPWAGATFLSIALGAAAARWLNARGALDASITTYALAMFAGMTVATVGHDVFGRKSASIDLVPAMQQVLTADMPIYSVQLLDHTLPFYLRRPMIKVQRPDELEFGTQQEPQKWLPTTAKFKQVWASGPHAMALMTPDTFASLQAEGLVMRPIIQNARRIAVVNFRDATP